MVYMTKPNSINIKTFIMKNSYVRWIALASMIFMLFLLSPILYQIQTWHMTLKLTRIPKVEVIDIWGNKDTSLEEISARIKVNEKHEIVLHNLSKDVFKYPNIVYISELNGCHFYPYKAGQIETFLNIGTDGDISKHLGLTFHSPKDIVENIDSISNFFENLKKYPEINYICDTAAKTEMFLHILDEKPSDSIPFFSNYNERYDFVKNLDWKY